MYNARICLGFISTNDEMEKKFKIKEEFYNFLDILTNYVNFYNSYENDNIAFYETLQEWEKNNERNTKLSIINNLPSNEKKQEIFDKIKNNFYNAITDSTNLDPRSFDDIFNLENFHLILEF